MIWFALDSTAVVWRGGRRPLSRSLWVRTCLRTLPLAVWTSLLCGITTQPWTFKGGTRTFGSLPLKPSSQMEQLSPMQCILGVIVSLLHFCFHPSVGPQQTLFSYISLWVISVLLSLLPFSIMALFQASTERSNRFMPLAHNAATDSCSRLSFSFISLILPFIS